MGVTGAYALDGMPTLTNKVALVTGSSRGIGAEVARHLGQAGAKVVVNYAGNKAEADKVVAQIREAGSDAIAVQADVTKADAIRKLFDESIGRFGKLDVLVNNAGKILYKKLGDISDAEFDDLWKTNVSGVFYCLREAAHRLADGGRIINLSSTTTRLLLPTYGAYVATKAAVEQMTRVLAKELGPRGITVNTVSPGPVETDLFLTGKTPEQLKQAASLAALNRLGKPEDIARVIAFLASDDAAWVNAQNIGANGGIA